MELRDINHYYLYIFAILGIFSNNSFKSLRTLQINLAIIHVFIHNQ